MKYFLNRICQCLLVIVCANVLISFNTFGQLEGDRSNYRGGAIDCDLFPNNPVCEICGPGGGAQLGVITVASDEVIVKVNPNLKSEYKKLQNNLGVKVVKSVSNIGAEVWQLPNNMKVRSGTKEEFTTNYQKKVDFLNNQSEILYAEPNYEYGLSSNDQYFSNQWALNSSSGNINAVDYSKNCGVIGVVDSGIDWQHEDLVNNIYQNLGEDADGDGVVLEWDGSKWIFDPGDENGIDDDGNGFVDDFIGWDFVNNDNDPRPDDYAKDIHGTHIAGTIAAEGHNGIGVAGICHSAQMVALKCFDDDGAGEIINIISALDYCVNNNIKVINNSYGGSQCSLSLYESIENIFDNNTLFICAAGNNSADLSTAGYYPATYSKTLENIISVVATNEFEGLYSRSNYGDDYAHIAAPGECVFSTYPTGVSAMSANGINYYGKGCYSQAVTGYGSLSGTSMAAAHVTGAVALMMEKYPAMSIADIKERLYCRSKQLSSLDDKCESGAVLNLFNVVADETELKVAEEKRNGKNNFAVVPQLLNADYEWFFGTTQSYDVADAAIYTTKETPAVGLDKSYTWNYCVIARDKECGNIIFQECGGVANKNGQNLNSNFTNSVKNIYPNPVQDKININYELNQEGPVSMSLYNTTGQKVQQLMLDELKYQGIYNQQYDLNELSSGIYFLVINTPGGQFNQKIYKQ